MGFILLDKPAGITSHDVVRAVRRISHKKKVGHAGTLDPFATGLLIIMLGKATRLAEYLLDLPKTYITTITLGATSDTDDVTGKTSTVIVNEIPEEHQIKQTLETFVGTIQQVPPIYSALKFRGKPFYYYARAGLPAEALAKAGERPAPKPRPVKIYVIKLLSYHYPQLVIQVTCGRGTYLRALARDLGAALKTGGYCSTLHRLAIGQFAIKDAYKLTSLPTELSTAIQPIELLVNHLPKITLSANNVAKFKQGKAVTVNPPLTPNTVYAALDSSSKIIGLGQADSITPTLLRPLKNIS